MDYKISGVHLTDYRYHPHGRCVFDPVLSNPDSVRLHRPSPQQHRTALGCGH